MNLLEFLFGFEKVVLCILRPLPDKIKLKFCQGVSELVIGQGNDRALVQKKYLKVPFFKRLLYIFVMDKKKPYKCIHEKEVHAR